MDSQESATAPGLPTDPWHATLTDPTLSPINSISAEILLRVLDLSHPNSEQLLALSLLSRKFTSPAQTLLFRDVRFYAAPAPLSRPAPFIAERPRSSGSRGGRGTGGVMAQIEREVKESERQQEWNRSLRKVVEREKEIQEDQKSTGTRAKSVAAWIESPARRRYSLRSLDMEGVGKVDVRQIVEHCVGVKEIWNIYIEIGNDWSVLTASSFSGLERLGVRFQGHFQGEVPYASEITLPFHLIHLEFKGNFGDECALTVFSAILNSSKPSLIHLNMWDCRWSIKSRKQLFAKLSEGDLPKRLLSLGLPWARADEPESNEGDDENDNVGDEEEDERGVQGEEEECLADDYLTTAEGEFLAKCTSLRTFGSFRLPTLEYCPMTVDTCIMWFDEIFESETFENVLDDLKPQLRRLRLATVGSGEDLEGEDWYEDSKEDDSLDVMCDDRAKELRFGFD
ncbi:hypothetical protein P7C70_g941, partial [Phenoliferia sp. Uapishka_3]